MNIKDEALKFAINAHDGQVRKSEKDKPMIIHPYSVGKILEEYKCNDSVVAAGYLHDVIEDTKYTYNDIENKFGKEIADLVMSASEPDKSLSWEERKQYMIDHARNLPLNNKYILIADKINNLEDLYLLNEKNGKKDFSNFNRGEESQKWYYYNMYKSLITNEDENLPIFKRLKKNIDLVFNKQEDKLSTYYVGNEEYYKKVKELDARLTELQNLKKIITLDKPYVIEATGTPRTGKTSTLEDLSDYYKKGGFKVDFIPEFTTSKKYKEELKEYYSKLPKNELCINILKEIRQELEDAMNKDSDIIIIDRSINDRQIWNYTYYLKGFFDKNTYEKLRDTYQDISKNIIDYLLVTTASSSEAIKRDYLSHVSIRPRSFLNEENVNNYNNSLESLNDLLKNSVNTYFKMDTTNTDLKEERVKVIESTAIDLRKKYINKFNEDMKIRKR